MDDETVGQFISITGTTPERAQQYLRITDGDIEQAIELFYTSDGVDLEGVASQAPPVPPPQSRPAAPRQAYQDVNGVVHIDSEEEDSGNDEDDPEVIRTRTRRPNRTQESTSHNAADAIAPIHQPNRPLDDDESMARRLQEEFYAGGDLGGGLDTEGIRAPIARTRETLVGPEGYDADDADEMHAAVLEQMRARQRHRPQGRPGIFNQQPVASSIWNNLEPDPNSRGHRAQLAQATAGASEVSSKSNLLAEMYRPPFEIMSRSSWEEARVEGKQNEKWILVNVQDPAIFDCQVLNRDIWKNPGIKETVQENFIFMQYAKDDPRGNQYIQYYFQARENQEAYPHIAIVDPRTGEQVKVWSGPPAPKAMEFLMQLHEFLDRYSLKVTAKNPVARRKPEPKKEKQVEKMTEEEMLEMALQNSLAGTSGRTQDDPDDLTRSMGDVSRGNRKTEEEDAEMADLETKHTNGQSELETQVTSPFAAISSTNPHVEPSADSTSTRIQFRHPNGRVVRRFLLADPVQRIYEWLKSSPLEGKEGVDFELVSMQKNLVDMLGESIEQAGLKNGTVMVEFIDRD